MVSLYNSSNEKVQECHLVELGRLPKARTAITIMTPPRPNWEPELSRFCAGLFGIQNIRLVGIRLGSG